MIRFLVIYWLLLIISVMLCLQMPRLLRPLTRFLGLLYSLLSFFISLFSLWIWLYPPFWQEIIAALLGLLTSFLCVLAVKIIKHVYLVSLLWLASGLVIFLATQVVSLRIAFSLFISLPPILLAGFSLLSLTIYKPLMSVRSKTEF